MSEDILHRLHVTNQNSYVHFTPNMCNETMICNEDICLEIANNLMKQIGITVPYRSTNNLFDRDL